MGRLWQTLILSKWHPPFAYMPVESIVHKHQRDYYQALNQSTQQSDSAPFIDFMLTMILATLTSTTPQVSPHVTPQVIKLLKALKNDMSRDQLLSKLRLNDRKSFRERYLLPALTDCLIEMTIPDKPTSRLQKYRLTVYGKERKQANI